MRAAALALTLLAAGCAKAPRDRVSIRADRLLYSPAMSSTVGIGLTPSYEPAAGGPAPGGPAVVFHWRAEGGRFLRWAPPDYKVTALGTDVRNGGEKIFWSYDPADGGSGKPQPAVSLAVEDAKTGAPLAAARLRLRWKEGAVEVFP